MAYTAAVADSIIDVTNIRDLLVQGDTAFPTINFTLPAGFTGLTWRVRGTFMQFNLATQSEELAVTGSTTISIAWPVGSNFTTYYGEMQIVLVGTDALGNLITKATGYINVQRDYSISTVELVDENLFEQLMAELANSALLLDQTTPQTFVGGIPKLAADRVIDHDNELADKKYVDDHTPPTPVHNDLGGLQGGTTGEYYHTTQAQNAALHSHANKTALDAVSGTNTGDQSAAGVANTPAGNIAATTVQAAINELDTEKEAVTNKVPSITSTSTDTQYPSAKCVYESFSTHNSDVNAHANLAWKSELAVKADLASVQQTYSVDMLYDVVAPWYVGAVSSGTYPVLATPPAKHPGVLILKSHATNANSGAYMRLSTDAMLLSGGEKTTIIFGTPASLIGRLIWLGFHDSVNVGLPTDGVYAKIENATLNGNTSNNNTRSATGSGYTLSTNTYYRLVIELNADATLATYTLYADDSSTILWSDTLSTNIPKTRTTGHAVVGTFGSPSVAMDIIYLDYADVVFNGARRISDLAPATVSDGDAGYPTYDKATHRFVLPTSMYLVNGEPLPLYKHNIVAAVDTVLDQFKTAVINVETSGRPTHRYFYEDIDLDGAVLGSTFLVAAKAYSEPNYIYQKTINKVACAASAKSGQSINVICIGDSITNREVPSRLKTKLATYGVTATMLGTMANEGGQNGEGREGWEFAHFVGSDNTHSATPIVRQISAGASTVYLNPFLKLADATDIANHPTWCFRNTGADIEKSYASDADKTGNFYLFDFANYLSVQGLATPDVVTIALGTNDILHDLTVSLANSRLGLEIMAKQIKTACPDCIVGVIPSPAWGSTFAGTSAWANYVATWIENCITDVASFGLSEVYIVPIWCHQNADFGFPYDVSTAISSVNTSVEAHREDYLHPAENGKREYANALGAFVLNVI